MGTIFLFHHLYHYIFFSCHFCRGIGHNEAWKRPKYFSHSFFHNSGIKGLTKITPSDSAYQKTLLQKFQAIIYKNIEFPIFFARGQITDACLFVFLLFFPTGDRIDRLVLESCERAYSKGY